MEICYIMLLLGELRKSTVFLCLRIRRPMRKARFPVECSVMLGISPVLVDSSVVVACNQSSRN